MPKLPTIGWWDNFKGRCVACKYASPTTRSQEMLCGLEKAARNCGLPSRPGGTWMGEPVHKLFGCVFFEQALSAYHAPLKDNSFPCDTGKIVKQEDEKQ